MCMERAWRNICKSLLLPRVCFGGGLVMFWDGIQYDSRTELIVITRPAMTAQRYVEEQVVLFTKFVSAC